jgi:tetratricopeptide (TPR) repeat protein
MKHFKNVIVLCLVVAILLSAGSVLASKNKAKEFYDKGEAFASEGNWDKAADAFDKAQEEYAKYKDVAAKLQNARIQAAAMLITMGDDAKSKEKFDDALACYQKALKYQPASVEAKDRYNNLSQDMVSKYYNRGRTYESQNLWKDAFTEYEKAYAINPDYQDLADYYNRAKAKLQGNVPMRALLFIVNRSDQLGIENQLIQDLQDELSRLGPSKKFCMIDYRKVQKVMDEQAGSLGDKLNDGLAMDIGRILDADQVVVGNIVSDNKDKVKITVRILKVPSQDLVKEAKITQGFSKKKELNPELLKLAKELAKKLATAD